MASGWLFEEEGGASNESDSETSVQFEYIDKESENITPNLPHNEEDFSSEEDDLVDEDQKPPPRPGNGLESQGDTKPNTYIRDQFKEYCAHATTNFIPFPKMKSDVFDFSRF